MNDQLLMQLLQYLRDKGGVVSDTKGMGNMPEWWMPGISGREKELGPSAQDRRTQNAAQGLGGGSERLDLERMLMDWRLHQAMQQRNYWSKQDGRYAPPRSGQWLRDEPGTGMDIQDITKNYNGKLM
jgi:hypothetical protein